MTDNKILLVVDGGMDKRLLLAAMAGLAAASMAHMPIDMRRNEVPDAPRFGWKPPKWFRKAPPKVRRNVSSLQRQGWPETPCEAPDGYFWHRAPLGRQLYYLLKDSPGDRTVQYDERFDRSIIWSGWGYVKPTYAPGDVR